MTAVLIVKTQYIGSPRNRKVESHFTTTSFLIVRTQHFGSPRNHKVKGPTIEDVRTSFLIVETQYLGSPRHHKVKNPIIEDVRRPWIAVSNHKAQKKGSILAEARLATQSLMAAPLAAEALIAALSKR